MDSRETFRQPQLVGDLGLREVLEEEQADQAALEGRELVEGVAQRDAVLDGHGTRCLSPHRAILGA